MKRVIIVMMTAIMLSSCCANRFIAVPTSQLPGLQDVVSEIQLQYKQAIKELADQGITNVDISEAEVTLKVAKDQTRSGELKVLIGKFSKERTVSRSTAVTYTLSQAKNTAGAGIAKFADTNIKDVIVGSAKEFNSLEATIGTLVKESFSISIVFSISNKNSAGLSFDIQNVGASAGVDWSRTVEHDITLTFKNKAKPAAK